MGQTIAGAIVGGITSTLNYAAQQKQLNQEKKLAKKQYAQTQRAFEEEQQERAKVNQKQPDVEALLEQNTSNNRASTDLTGGGTKKKTKLFSGSSQLGVNSTYAN